MENSDPRYVRSREGLRRALVELAHEEPSKINVRAICERSGVERATFYRHFNELDDLIADTLADLAERGAAEWKAVSRGTGDQYEASESILREYFHHIEDNWLLYRWALGPNGSAKTIHAVLQRTISSVELELQALIPAQDPLERELRGAYAGGGLLGICLLWLKSETPRMSPDKLAAWVTAMAPNLAPFRG